MKRTLILIASLLTATAADLRLAWDNNPPADQVARYHVYQSDAAGTNWTRVATVATNAVTITNLPPGQYRFRVTATNAWGESQPSDPVSTPSAPAKPTGLNLQLYVNLQ
jgi:predicted phage tail protein